MSKLILGWQDGTPRRAAGFQAWPKGEDTRARRDLIEDGSEAHVLVTGPTGAGKGRSLIIPNLLQWKASAIVIDIKGENAMTTARYRRELGQRVVILDPFRTVSDGSDALNPLDWASDNEEYVEDNAMRLSETMTGSRRSEKEPFWDDEANDVTAGLIAHCATQPDPAKRTLGYVHDILTADDTVLDVAVMLDTSPNMNPYARRQLANFLQHEGEKVRSSIRSTAQQHVRIFSSPLVQRSVSRTTFDLGAVRDGEPVTIYLVIPASRLVSHAGLLRIWLAVLLGVIAERRQRPEQPTLLIVDELAQLGPMPLLLQAVTLLRGYGLRAMLLLQSMSQLKTMWPTDFQTVIDNCGAMVSFGPVRPNIATELTGFMGTASAEQFDQMSTDQVMLSMVGQPAAVARKLDYLRDSLFSGRYDPNGFYQRR
jgi:type IV secretion system protein VirD4